MTLQDQITEALKNGNWMLRRSDDGEAYGGFQWAPVGEWTEAPDWNQKPTCGGGLHGNGPRSTGHWTNGKDLDFCITDGNFVDIDGEKGKVRRAMVVLRNVLPEGLHIGGSLYLRGTQITALPEGLQGKAIF